MKADKRSHREGIWFSLWPLMTVIIIVVMGIISGMTDLDIIRTGILSLILTAVAALYVRIQKINLMQIRYAVGIILASSLIPLVLIILQPEPEVFSFWMIGGFLTAALVDTRLGVIIFIGHTLILGIANSLMPEAIIRFLAIALLLALLAKGLSEAATFIYSAIIILSSNITLAFVMNNFIFKGQEGHDYVSSLISFAVVLTATFLLSLLYKRIAGEALPNEHNVQNVSNIRDGVQNQLNESAAEAASAINDIHPDTNVNLTIDEGSIATARHGARAGYDVLLKEDNELLLKLKLYSDKLYNHCKRVGELSAAAARTLQADDQLSMAGGLYHEIGRIKGNNYMEEGLKLAEEYAFPPGLVNILKQHNINHDRPTSVEAAIVMLSDNIISTIEYIGRQQGNKVTYDKIIDSIFKMRMEKGTFDESGLTLKDFKVLKEYYLNEFKPT